MYYQLGRAFRPSATSTVNQSSGFLHTRRKLAGNSPAPWMTRSLETVCAPRVNLDGACCSWQASRSGELTKERPPIAGPRWQVRHLSPLYCMLPISYLIPSRMYTDGVYNLTNVLKLIQEQVMSPNEIKSQRNVIARNFTRLYCQFSYAPAKRFRNVTVQACEYSHLRLVISIVHAGREA